MHPETKHGSVEDKPRDDTGRIQSRQNGETGNRLRQQLVDEVSREPVESEDKGRGYEYAENAYIPVDEVAQRGTSARASIMNTSERVLRYDLLPRMAAAADWSNMPCPGATLKRRKHSKPTASSSASSRTVNGQ
jgi:hypothetical protein